MNLMDGLLSFLVLIIGVILCLISKKKIYKETYNYRMGAYIMFLTAIFIYLKQYIVIAEVLKSLEVFTTISATIAGFVFTGISIIFALLNVEYINSLFKNDFLDKVFYKSYGVVILSLINIAMYTLIKQFYLIYLNQLIVFYLYIFWITILLYLLMISDFIKVIKRAKKDRR